MFVGLDLEASKLLLQAKFELTKKKKEKENLKKAPTVTPLDGKN